MQTKDYASLMVVMVPKETLIEQRLDALEQKVDALERKVDEGFTKVDERFNRLEDRVEGLNRTLIGGFFVLFAALIGSNAF
ncbi:MAG: hemolysin XhlA family protein [Actinomycetota bacterium]|nr:hemolysin XhlA family protein [Actinomycetota bacterium]